MKDKDNQEMTAEKFIDRYIWATGKDISIEIAEELLRKPNSIWIKYILKRADENERYFMGDSIWDRLQTAEVNI